MIDKQIKEELKQVVTNLGNIEFTVEDELKFCKEVLKRKEQECEALGQAYLETNELLQEKTKECTNLKAEKDELNKCYKNNSATLDFEETNTTKLINKVMKLEKTLIEIKDIAKYDVYTTRTDLCLKLNWIKNKIRECEVKEQC